MPYWAELWPAGLALARALPARARRRARGRARLRARRAVARRRRARRAVTAIDWAADAIELLHGNAAATARRRRPCAPTGARSTARFDLALAADVLYEQRNVEPLLDLLPRLAPRYGSPSRAGRRGRLPRPGTRALARRGAGRARLPAHFSRRSHLTTPRSCGAAAHERRLRTADQDPHRDGRGSRRHGDRESSLIADPPATIGRMLGGVLTAIATPFDEDGAVDFDAFQRLAAHLVDNGSDGLVVAGTTGEARRSPTRERLDLVRAAIEAVGDRATVVAGTGTNDTAHSVHMTEQATRPAPTRSSSSRRTTTSRRSAASSRTSRRSRARPTGRSSPTTSRAASSSTSSPRRSRGSPRSRTSGREAGERRLAQARHIVETGLDLYAGDDNLLQPFLELGGTGGICVHTHVVGPQVAEQVRAAARRRRRPGPRARPRARAGLRAAPDHDEPDPDQGRAEPARPRRRAARLPLVPPTDDELAAVRGCLARLGLLVAA